MAATPADWTLDDLRLHLQAAVEIELLVIPPYLAALYSLHPATNSEASAIIRSVVVEEMLHLILAANVLNAVGGRPTVVDPRWVPKYPAKIPHHSGTFAVSLRPFDDAALDGFLMIENPSYARADDLAAPLPGAAVPRLLTLGSDGDGEDADADVYDSIGAFYKAVEEGLTAVVARLGAGKVFTGDPARQIGREHYYASGGTARKVCCLESALEALDEIVEQGEGELTIPPSGEKFDADRDLAHFYRFNELRRRRRYLADDMPDEPTGAPIDVNLAAVFPMKIDLRIDEIADGPVRRATERCAELWTRLLWQIEDAITGRPGALQEAVTTMFDLRYSAEELLRLPLPGSGGQHAGPTFEYLTSAREVPREP